MLQGILPRLRGLLDIYSPSLIARLCVLSLMALGVLLLWQGMQTGSGVGALPFLLIVWANASRFLATLDGLLTRQAWLLVAVPVLVFGARLVAHPPAASDDLLRHIAVNFWPGGYAEMYLHTSLPPVSLYPSFDGLAGFLARLLGAPGAMWAMQASAFLAFVTVFVLAGRKVMRGHALAMPLVVVAMALVLQVMASRLFLARPEIFLSIWALSALLVKSWRGTLLWGVVGMVLGSGYWLAALYFPAVILLPQAWRARVAVFIALSATWLGMWWILSGGQLLDAFVWTFAQVANRIPGIEVSENASIVNLLMSPTVLLVVCASLWAAQRSSSDGRLLLLAAYFLMSNQVRYGGIVIPLLALHSLSVLHNVGLRWTPWGRPFVLAFASVTLSVVAVGLPDYRSMPRFALPEGARVITGFSSATYSTLFWNLGAVQISPAFEVGALDPNVQSVVRELNRGKANCRLLQRFDYTHLIENRLRGPAPPCLSLLSTQDGWRLWAVGAGS